jgi:hypothetical protein
MDTVVKPGWQTTEFWMPLISLVVGGLVAYGYVPAKDATSVMGNIAALVVGSITLGGNLVLALHYIRSRTTQKAKLTDLAVNQAQYRACMASSGPTIDLGGVKIGPVPENPAKA